MSIINSQWIVEYIKIIEVLNYCSVEGRFLQLIIFTKLKFVFLIYYVCAANRIGEKVKGYFGQQSADAHAYIIMCIDLQK